MKVIKDTELILTAENKVYHLNLSAKEIADTIIIVGDRGRVKPILRHRREGGLRRGAGKLQLDNHPSFSSFSSPAFWALRELFF